MICSLTFDLFLLHLQQRDPSPSLSDERDGSLSDIVLQNELKVSHQVVSQICHTSQRAPTFTSLQMASAYSRPLSRYILKSCVNIVIEQQSVAKCYEKEVAL